MNHLVVGHRQHEPLREGVHHGEGHILVVVLAEPRIHFQIVADVVHPPHVPLEVEAQTSLLYGPCDLGPRRGLLRRRQGRRIHGSRHPVQILQKGDGLQILMAAVDVGPPLLSVIVQIQHRCHGIHPQAVHVVLPQPPRRRGQQEAPHLAPAEVKDPCPPSGVLPLQGVAVLVQAGAVEIDEPVLILAEVGRHPVQNHGDPGPMHPIHEIFQILRGAVAGGGCKIPHTLIPPRVIQRILRHRQQLHGVIAHVPNIGGQPVRQLPIGEKAAVLLPLPGAGMHLVDVEWPLPQRLPAALLPPCRIPPRIGCHLPQTAGVRRTQLAVNAVGIRLPAGAPVGALHHIFIALPHLGLRHRGLPDALRPAVHGKALPVAEVPRHPDAPSIGGIDPEAPALRRAVCAQQRLRLLPAALEKPFQTAFHALPSVSGAGANSPTPPLWAYFTPIPSPRQAPVAVKTPFLRIPQRKSARAIPCAFFSPFRSL